MNYQAENAPQELSRADPNQSAQAQEDSRLRWMVGIAGILVLISATQYLIPTELSHWHHVLQRLYYFPIIAAGLSLGWRGGILAALIAGISYKVHSPSKYAPGGPDLLDQYLEMMVFCLVGIVTGFLADRERRHQQALAETAKRLAEVYRELQNNIEHVKRAARMSALGHLSAGLAHEIRNPLASIEGAASIVQRDSQNETRRQEFLEIIQRECWRLNRLVTNFLDFARPRQPHLQPTDMVALLDSVLSLVSHTAAKGLVEFRTEISHPLPFVKCDAEQVKQVLLNLVLNAIQSMPQGGEVVVSARTETPYLMIRIQDRGSGISPEHVDSIYDPFFTTKENGTGLGLPVAYQIMEQHGGLLELSENGPEGATFTIHLPYNAKTST